VDVILSESRELLVNDCVSQLKVPFQVWQNALKVLLEVTDLD